MQDEEIRRAVGTRLKECRIDMGLSQPDVGRSLGRTPQLVSKWELGKSLPHPNDWYQLGVLYGTSLDYLFYGVRTQPVGDSAALARIFSGAASGTCTAPIDP